MLQLQFFGPPAVSVDGAPVSFRSRKSLALLANLVLEAGRHSRKALTALLWPDSDSERGRATLRRTLALLREELGDVADACLQAERETLAFVPQAAVTCDVDLLVEASRLLNYQPPPADLLPRLQVALGAYRGEFLAGFSLNDAEDFDTWRATKREHWHRRFSAILDRLTAEQLAAGTAVIEMAAWWVAHDPLDETAHRRLMRAHAAAGDRAALRAYERCRELLVRELDIEPDPETQALAAQLRESVSVVAAPVYNDLNPQIQTQSNGSGSRSSVLGSLSTAIATPHLLEGPLVGRATEFAMLTAAYATVVAGATQVALIAGESGIGKTRLAHEMLRWAASQGAEVLHGRALELTSQAPYQPLLDALRPLLAHAAPDLLDTDWLAELSRLIPELRARLPKLPPPTSDERLAQSRLFSAVTLLVAQLARRAPLLLLLDNAQWADSATRDLLAYALRTWAAEGQPILVLLTARAEDLATPNHPLNGWLAALRRDLPLARRHLDALSAADTMQFVVTLGSGTQATPAGAQPTAEFARFGQQLYAATQGQPLFLLETLRPLLDQGDLLANQHNGTWQITITPTTLSADPTRTPAVRDLIHARLAYLGLPAQRLLLAVAVLGEQASFEMLLAVTGMDDESGLVALDEDLQRRFVQVVEIEEANGAQLERYRFLHDMVREVLYADAGEPRRRVLHRRVLEALAQGRAAAATFAYHAEQARQDETLLRYSTQAGDEAV